MTMLLSTSTAGSTIPSIYTPPIESVNTITIEMKAPVDEVPFVENKARTNQSLPRVTALVGEEQEVIDAILKIFPPIMVEVARCESGLRPEANRVGVDLGLFQINQIHLPEVERLGLDRLILEDNLTFANILYSTQGLNPWYMSEHCWRRYA